MNHLLRAALAALVFASGACNGTTTTEDAGGGDKAALEAAAKLLREPVALIAAYQPSLRGPDGKDPYAPQRRNDALKAMACAAGEVRFAANGARQKLTPAPATKDVEAALAEVSKSCADAQDDAAFEQCGKSVAALDAALGKTAAAATAAGVTTKIPRVAPDAVTDEAKKAIAPFLKAKGPGPAEQAYIAKRGDAKAEFGDVSAACQAADDEASQVAAAFEKAEEPLRLTAVTHKLALDTQCRILGETDTLRHDLADCKGKKAKSTECKIVCSKVKTRVEEGLPAAVFATLQQDADKICEK
jgi:hypothetical protein